MYVNVCREGMCLCMRFFYNWVHYWTKPRLPKQKKDRTFNQWSSTQLQLKFSWTIHMQMSSRSTVEVQLSFNYMQICELNVGWTIVEKFTCKWARIQLLNLSWVSTRVQLAFNPRSIRVQPRSTRVQLSFNSRSTRVQLAFNSRSTVESQLIFNSCWTVEFLLVSWHSQSMTTIKIPLIYLSCFHFFIFVFECPNAWEFSWHGIFSAWLPWTLKM